MRELLELVVLFGPEVILFGSTIVVTALQNIFLNQKDGHSTCGRYNQNKIQKESAQTQTHTKEKKMMMKMKMEMEMEMN